MSTELYRNGRPEGVNFARTGETIEEGKFCPACGAPVNDADERFFSEEQSTAGWVSPSGMIIQGPDGVYRWAYEFNLLTNPSIFFTISRVMAISLFFVWAFVSLLEVLDGRPTMSSFLENTMVFLCILAGLLVLTLVSYLIYAAIMGGKYCVLFEMDERRITHTQAPRQFKRAQIVALITGLTARKIGTVGTALLAGSKNSSTSTWKHVKNVQCCPRRHVIYVNQLLHKNQVYIFDEDFEFVREYIVSRCTNAKIKG